jgi:hypothetical protein
MRKAPLFIAFPLLAAAGPAAPEAPKPGPSEERPASSPVSPGPRLNLKLDDPARYTRETPREGNGSADALPSVGGNARPLPASSTPTTPPSYPKDTERGER